MDKKDIVFRCWAKADELLKKIFLFSLSSVLSLSAMAQSTQPCVVKQYNQKEQKTPLPGVEVIVSNAGSSVSDNAGELTLAFRTLKPGDKVNLVSAKKNGFELMNTDAVEQWNIAADQRPFELVMVNSAFFAQLKARLKETSMESYRSKYDAAVKEIDALKRDAKISEQDYNRRLDELEAQYMNSLNNIDTYIDQFARIDLSEVSAEEQRILEMVDQGRIDEAVEAWDELDILNKLLQEKKAHKQLAEAEQAIREAKEQANENIGQLEVSLRNQIATLKLAGGKENYDKIGRILKENALADTTDVVAVLDYAGFALQQRDFIESERFNLMALRIFTERFNQAPDVYRASLAMAHNNLGYLFYCNHDYAKSEEYYLKALENCTILFSQNPDAYRLLLAKTQKNLGLLYCRIHDYVKSEECYLKALENYTVLFGQNPDAYRADWASTHHNLGGLYSDIHDYVKSEEYYLKALEDYTILFSQNPDAYRADLANIHNNLGLLYLHIHDYVKSEEFCQKALESYTELFNKNPDAYRADLARTQNNLAMHFYRIHNYAKSEEYYLKALEDYTILFSQNPDAYRAALAKTYNNLGRLYDTISDYAKSEECFQKALENYTILFGQNQDAYRGDLATTQNNLGHLLYINHDYAKSEEYYLKALENYTVLFNQNPDAYMADWTIVQNNLGALFCATHDYAKSEEFYLKALENYTILFKQNPDAYRTDFAAIHNNLGAHFFAIHDYAKSEEHYLKSLENFSVLFSQNPDAYRANMAEVCMVLMLIYGQEQKWEQFDDMLEQALAHCEELIPLDSQYQQVVEYLRRLKKQRSAQNE